MHGHIISIQKYLLYRGTFDGGTICSLDEKLNFPQWHRLVPTNPLALH